MPKKSREEEFWSIFTDGGVTPIVFDPNDPTDNQRGIQEIAQRISEAVAQIKTDDKPKA